MLQSQSQLFIESPKEKVNRILSDGDRVLAKLQGKLDHYNFPNGLIANWQHPHNRLKPSTIGFLRELNNTLDFAGFRHFLPRPGGVSRNIIFEEFPQVPPSQLKQALSALGYIGVLSITQRTSDCPYFGMMFHRDHFLAITSGVDEVRQFKEEISRLRRELETLKNAKPSPIEKENNGVLSSSVEGLHFKIDKIARHIGVIQ